MTKGLRSWRQKIIIKHPVTAALVTVAIVLAALVLLGGYQFHWDWTGFHGSNKADKTLWDWLQLLFIPVVLTLGAIWYTARQNHDLEITADNQHETELQTYLDKMSELLLHENLRKSELNDDVRYIARARTLTALSKLNPKRKRSIIVFLYEAGLIDFDDSIIDLRSADLSEVNLNQLRLGAISFEGANIQGADFSGADLSMANLEDANLQDANFFGASLHIASMKDVDMREADFTKANLKGVTGICIEELEKQAKSLKGATMPDGTIHP